MFTCEVCRSHGKQCFTRIDDQHAQQSSRSWGTNEHTEPASTPILDGTASNTYQSCISQLVCLKHVSCSFALLLLCILLALLDQRTSRLAGKAIMQRCYLPSRSYAARAHSTLRAKAQEQTAAHPHTPAAEHTCQLHRWAQPPACLPWEKHVQHHESWRDAARGACL
jgi:hypothetical protein